MRFAGHVAHGCLYRGLLCYGDVYRVLVGKPEGKRQLERPRRKCEDNIKMNLQEEEYGGMEWIELAEDRDRWGALVHSVMNLRIP
jgi:hypothetical protein